MAGSTLTPNTLIIFIIIIIIVFPQHRVIGGQWHGSAHAAAAVPRGGGGFGEVGHHSHQPLDRRYPELCTACVWVLLPRCHHTHSTFCLPRPPSFSPLFVVFSEAEILCRRICIVVNGAVRCLGSPQHLKVGAGCYAACVSAGSIPVRAFASISPPSFSPS